MLLSHPLGPETHSVGGEGSEGTQLRRRDRNSGILCILCSNPSTGVGFCKDIHYEHFTGVKGGGRMAERHIMKKENHQKEEREISVGRKVHS